MNVQLALPWIIIKARRRCSPPRRMRGQHYLRSSLRQPCQPSGEEIRENPLPPVVVPICEMVSISARVGGSFGRCCKQHHTSQCTVQITESTNSGVSKNVRAHRVCLLQLLHGGGPVAEDVRVDRCLELLFELLILDEWHIPGPHLSDFV